MAFGPQLFNSGQLTTQQSSALVSPPSLLDGEPAFSRDSVSEDIQAIVEARREPIKGIQLSEDMISPSASFITRRGQPTMPNKNPESFLRQGGLIVDQDTIYLDSFEQSQVPSANLRGAMMQLVQGGIANLVLKSFTKEKVVGAKELVKNRFRV